MDYNQKVVGSRIEWRRILEQTNIHNILPKKILLLYLLVTSGIFTGGGIKGIGPPPSIVVVKKILI